jgi:hypothetical protein
VRKGRRDTTSDPNRWGQTQARATAVPEDGVPKNPPRTPGAAVGNAEADRESTGREHGRGTP